MSNRSPAPLAVPSSGTAAFDDAVRVVQSDFCGEGKHVARAFARLKKLSPAEQAHFANLLVPAAWSFGGSGEWDDDVARKMKPTQRAAYKAAHDAAYAAHHERTRYFAWLVDRLTESAVGCERLHATMSKRGTPDTIRRAIGEALSKSPSAAARTFLEQRFPPESWARMPEPKLALVRARAEALIREDRKGSFGRLAPMLADRKTDPVVAAAILAAVDRAQRPEGMSRFAASEKQKVPADPRWVDVALRFAESKATDVATNALLVLLGQPVSPEWRPCIEAARARIDADGGDVRVADELLTSIRVVPEAKKRATKAVAAQAPLPPEKRHKAPRVAEPRLVRAPELAKTIDGLLARAELSHHRARLAQPALHLLTRRSDDAKFAPGATKVGGLPDLPKGSRWPENGRHAMGFVAQFRLEDLTALGERRLGTKGLLSFFVDDEPLAPGEGYLKKVAVLHSPDAASLVRLEPPASLQTHRAGKPARQPYAACEVRMVPTLTLPSPSHPTVTRHLRAAEARRYDAVKEAVAHPHVGQLLGYRDHGYDAENPESAQLVLRLTSDPQAGMEWGDLDCLDVYVPKKDLVQGRFGKAYAYVGD